MSRFEDCVEPHLAHLRRYARALSGDRTRADDLVQDTLERAWIKFHLWKPALAIRPWLFAVMHNVFVNQVKTWARRPQSSLSDDDMAHLIVRPNQSDMIEVDDLSRCLAQLPVEQREVLLLVSLEDMNYAQVAQVLSIPIGTVTSRLARGRSRLRALLDERGIAPSLKVVR
jgi:RNA polymerase sigma-70 factor (ECF subfamily)